MQVLFNDQRIILYHQNYDYEVIVKNDKLILPESKIVYKYYDYYNWTNNKEEKNTVLDVIFDLSDLSIGGFNQEIYMHKWKRKEGHHKRGYGTELNTLEVYLNKDWEFETV